MRILYRLLGIILLVSSVWWVTPTINVDAASLDTNADIVIGQPNFSSITPSTTASGLNVAWGIAIDANGHLYVSDPGNNRVLEYNPPFSSGMAANKVFGQPDFNTGSPNTGGVSAKSIDSPQQIGVDVQGDLYVVDQANARVLEYDTPISTDTIADRVFGQPDFVSSTPNNGGVSDHSLSAPYGVALDAQENLYVSDFGNQRVLEYNTPLTSDTIADRVFGQPDFISNAVNNGGVSAKSLAWPHGVAVDAHGDLFVTDSTNNRVLEYYTPLTTDTTADVAFGQPDFSSTIANNGGISGKSINLPRGAVLDARGDLYVSDGNNNRMLEFSPPFTSYMAASMVFGQGGGFTTNDANHGGTVSANGLNFPGQLAIDPQGNLYVADTNNNRILEFDLPLPNGVAALSLLSPSTVAAGSQAFTLTVNGTGFVSGSIVHWNGSDRPTTYLSSTQVNAAIAASDVTGGGPFSMTVSNPLPGGGVSGLLNLPLYYRSIKDTTADVVLGQPDFAGNLPNNAILPGGVSRLSGPDNVVVDPQTRRLFVTDAVNSRVLSWPDTQSFANGQPADLVIGQSNFTNALPNYGGVSARSLSFPYGLALDSKGNLYVSDANNNRVLEYSSPLTSGMAANMVFGQGGSFTSNIANNGGVNADSLNSAGGVAVDSQGNVFLADINNNRVLEFDTPLTTDTTADRIFGQPDFTSNSENNGGVISASSLFNPIGLALNTQGDLYVADFGNSRVLVYETPLKTDSTADHVFGQPGFFSGNFNNNGISAQSLGNPRRIALDAKGDLYVADSGNNRVVEYNSPLTDNEAATLVFGQGGSFTTNTPNNGGVSANSLDYPTGVAVDPQGNLFVADTFNNRVLEYDLPKLLLYTLSGSIKLNGTGLGGVSVANGDGVTVTTNSDGSYTFSGLLPGSYTLTPSKSGYHFTPPNRVVTVGPDATNLDFTAVSNITTLNLPLLTNNFGPFFLGPFEVEKNDTYQTANGLLIYSRLYTGYHNDANDFFSFKVDNNPTNITIIFNSTYIEAASHFQIQLIQLKGSGSTVIDSRAIPSTNMKESLNSGIYYIWIYTDPNPPNYINASKSYTIEVTSP